MTLSSPQKDPQLVLFVLLLLVCFCHGFIAKLPPQHNINLRAKQSRPIHLVQKMSDEASSSSTGDSLRAATGIRPSLHPTTINAIAEALKIRASNDEHPDTPLKVIPNKVEPLEVALSAGKIAATAIEKRQVSSAQDGMELTPQEGQTIAGRVVGVVMRLDELESQLQSKVKAVDWIKKYGEWDSFGVVEENDGLEERIKTDPLFCMSRAECLLALFLDTVEAPQMAKLGQEAPGGSGVDFLDTDRQEVLLTFQ